MKKEDINDDELLTIEQLAEHAIETGGVDDNDDDNDALRYDDDNDALRYDDDNDNDDDALRYDNDNDDDDNNKKSISSQLRSFVEDDDDKPLKFHLNIKSIIGGDGLSHLLARNWVFITVIVVSTCLYVTSRYLMQGATIEHSTLQKKLVDRKYKALTATSDYLEMTRTSNVENSLKDTTLHTSTDIPFQLTIE